jgi:hypothetical protein
LPLLLSVVVAAVLAVSLGRRSDELGTPPPVGRVQRIESLEKLVADQQKEIERRS